MLVPTSADGVVRRIRAPIRPIVSARPCGIWIRIVSALSRFINRSIESGASANSARSDTTGVPSADRLVVRKTRELQEGPAPDSGMQMRKV